MRLRVDEEAFTFAVETTAEISMLRQAVAFLFARQLVEMTPEDSADTLTNFEEEVSDMPPFHFADPAQTRFHEAVAAAMEKHATSFADSMRMILGDLRAGPDEP